MGCPCLPEVLRWHIGDQFLSAGANDFKVWTIVPYPFDSFFLTDNLIFRHDLHAPLRGYLILVKQFNYLTNSPFWNRVLGRELPYMI